MISTDLSKLRGLVDDDVIKTNMYDTLVAKINNTGTKLPSSVLLVGPNKQNFEIMIENVDEKILNTNESVRKTDCDRKVKEITDKTKFKINVT